MSVDVSVVIPAYNAARFLGTTLAMVGEQTRPPHEVIVVDDASTDDTARVAADGGARVLSIPHGGPAAARNRGVAAASCDWVAFLDADDVWHPRKLELQCAALAALPDIVLLATDFDEISETNELLVRDSVLRLEPYRALARPGAPDGVSLCDSRRLAALLPAWCFVLTSATIVRRDAFLAAGGFNPALMAEDVDLFLRLLPLGDAAMVELPLVGYVRHAQQMTARRAQEDVIAQLCRHVLRNPAAYRPESVRAARSRIARLAVRRMLPTLFRSAFRNREARPVLDLAVQPTQVRSTVPWRHA